MGKQKSLFMHRTTTQVKEFVKIKSEHTLRLKVKDAFFADYSVEVEDERVDFLVYHENEPFLWAESKAGATDIYEMFAQLLLTIKQQKIDSGEYLPFYLGVFDKEKIAFTEYHNALEVFNLNDFNWKECPSSVSKETVNKVARHLKNIVDYEFDNDVAEIAEFIRTNFVPGNIGTVKSQINKRNFVTIYDKWVREVWPSIDLSDNIRKKLKRMGVGDCDFYLADLLSENNKTIRDKLNIVLQEYHYKSKLKEEEYFEEHAFREIYFNDNGEAHARFWARYERPPAREYHDYIVERRDLLVPRNVRERKGAFFTPPIWVDKSQEYLAKVFGEHWQKEYYVWDCCAGTCNLLDGLTEKHRIWASTIDQPDVDIVHDAIRHGEIDLLESHVFRFDFLNDDFDKLPESLRNIINDPEKRKKLIIYMNPPYAEAANHGSRSNKAQVTARHKTSEQYKHVLGRGINELFANFFVRIHHLLPDAKIASFSTLKYVNSQNFTKFREHFLAEYKGGFVCPANTFDNVTGKFPIGFLIWDMSQKKPITKVKTDVLLSNEDLTSCRKIGTKTFFATKSKSFIIDWLRTFFDDGDRIGYMRIQGVDFQQNNTIFITGKPSDADIRESKIATITAKNIIEMSIYLAVRHCIEPTWLNNRDQFLHPNARYATDKEFQNDCLIYALFHQQNRIRRKDGKNHWIPFTAKEVDAKDNFHSTFMSDFLNTRKKLSKEAKAVFATGKALWKYYHQTIKTARRAVVDASLYEIREYFKGRDEKGRMKTKASDERFNELDAKLRSALKVLALKIQPKVYEYGFLRK